MRAMEDTLYLCNNQQMHFCKYVQLHVVVIHQHVSVTLVTINRVFCNRSTSSIQIIVHNCTIKPHGITLDYSVAFLTAVRYHIMLSLKYLQMCVCWLSYNYKKILELHFKTQSVPRSKHTPSQL
jgi:hypothetical protein